MNKIEWIWIEKEITETERLKEENREDGNEKWRQKNRRLKTRERGKA